MSHYRANIEKGDPAWAVTMNFGSTCTEQICTKAWVGEKVNVQTHIVTYMSPKITDMQGLGIENGGFCVGCPGHPDPDVIVNCARFGNMEPPGFARVWALFLLP